MNFQEFTDKLYNAGWNSTNDALLENVKKLWCEINSSIMEDMTTEQAAEVFSDVVKRNAASNVIRFICEFSYGDVHIGFDYRDPKVMKQLGASIKNLRGEWIE